MIARRSNMPKLADIARSRPLTLDLVAYLRDFWRLFRPMNSGLRPLQAEDVVGHNLFTEDNYHEHFPVVSREA